MVYSNNIINQKKGGEEVKIKVYTVKIRLYILKDIPLEDIFGAVTAFLDNGLTDSPHFAEFHNDNKYKNYCFDNPYPLEEDKIYKKGRIYTLSIRTLDAALAEYFSNYVVNTYTDKLKGLTSQVGILPSKLVDMLYTLTPAILKCKSSGYWRDEMSIEQYEERLKVNLIKKWNAFHGEKIDEDFELFTGVEFLNKCPIATKYKGIKLLGDKLRIRIADNEIAQGMAYMALGAGVLEMNSRGFGYVNYRWI